MKTRMLTWIICSLLINQAVLAQDKRYNDDIYYSKEDAEKERLQKEAQEKAERERLERERQEQERRRNDQELSRQSSGDNGNTNATQDRNASDFDSDDYYDYSYSTRIKRFHRPIVTYGYYDPYYTNAYWYNYDPYFYGTSVYMGYSWWGPSYYNSYYWSPGWYGPGSYWAWNSCSGWSWGWSYGWGGGWYGHNGWYGWGGWNGYHHGYHHGYQNGYWNGYYDGLYGNGYSPYWRNNNSYYFNSYDANSYGNPVTGPRGGNGVGSSGKLINAPRPTFQDKMTQAYQIQDVNKPRTNPYTRPEYQGRGVNATPVDGNKPVEIRDPGKPGKDNNRPVMENPRTNPYETQPATEPRKNPYETTPESEPRRNPYTQPEKDKGNPPSEPRKNPYIQQEKSNSPQSEPRKNPYVQPSGGGKQKGGSPSPSPSYQQRGGGGGYSPAPSGGGRSSGGGSAPRGRGGR